jgi:hypothetical protein
VIVAASLMVGRALLIACGWRQWSWLTPAVGVAALLAVTGTAAWLPGNRAPMLALTGAVLVASVAFLARNERLSALRGPARVGLPIALMALLAACLPFAFNGRFGVLGPRVLPDLVEHLFIAEWLQTGAGPEPFKVTEGYPLGPHGLAIAAGTVLRAPLDAAFTALLIAVPVLTALTALSAAGELAPLRRAGAALLTALPLLGAGYMLQSSFKEPLLALLALAFALGLRELHKRGPGGRLAAAPLVILAVGGFQVYSFPALIWFAGILVAWLVAEGLMHDRIAFRAVATRPWPYIWIGAAILVLGAATQWGPLAGFLGSRAGLGAFSARPQFLGNLSSALPVWEAFGVWPTPDYRFAPESTVVEFLSATIGALAVGYGTWWWVRRRDPALPAALLVCLGIWLCSHPFAVAFVTAKALAIAAPLAALVASTALLSVSPGSGRSARIARGALASAFLIGAAWSSILVLQGNQVAAGSEAAELARFRPLVKGRTVLSLGRDLFTLHHLRGATVKALGTVPELYVRSRHQKGTPIHSPNDPVLPEGDPLDFDNVSTGDLDRVDFVVTPRTGYQSAPPPNFREVASGRWLTLWRRRGPTPPRNTLVEPGAPGARLECTGGRLPPAGRAATFDPPPVARDPAAWQPVPGATGDGTADLRQRFRLPPGRWQISLQYSSQDGLEVRAPGLAARLPASLDYVGGFWPVGAIRSTGKPITVTVVARDRPLLARLLGRRVADATPELVLGRLAAVKAGSRTTVPLKRACGRYVDWYRRASR